MSHARTTEGMKASIGQTKDHVTENRAVRPSDWNYWSVICLAATSRSS